MECEVPCWGACGQSRGRESCVCHVHALTDDELLSRVEEAAGDIVVVSPACVHLPCTGVWTRSGRRGRVITAHTLTCSVGVADSRNLNVICIHTYIPYSHCTHVHMHTPHTSPHKHTHNITVSLLLHKQPSEYQQLQTSLPQKAPTAAQKGLPLKVTLNH